jgi:hypothetical protein
VVHTGGGTGGGGGAGGFRTSGNSPLSVTAQAYDSHSRRWWRVQIRNGTDGN